MAKLDAKIIAILIGVPAVAICCFIAIKRAPRNADNSANAIVQLTPAPTPAIERRLATRPVVSPAPQSLTTRTLATALPRSAGQGKSAANGKSLYLAAQTADLHALIAEIANPKYQGSLFETITLIALAGRGNPLAADALINYVRRPVDLSQGAIYSRQFSNKMYGLDMLGYIGTESAKQFLLKANTVEGAGEDAQLWSADSVKAITFSRIDEQHVLNDIRGNSTLGLTFFAADSSAIQNMIESEYANENERVNNNGKNTTVYSDYLVDSMARMALLRDIGIDGYAQLFNNVGDDTRQSDYLLAMKKYIINGNYMMVKH